MHIPPPDLQRLLAEEPFVRALANSLLADEADDVVQQTFLRAIGSPGPVHAPRSWLARIVRNLVADHRRRRQRRNARQRGEPSPPMVPSSAELLETEERRRSLVAAVDGLPEALRTVVLLRYFEGWPPRRIARELKVPVAAVWNRLHAALVALRRRLDDEHGGERRAWLLPLVPFATSPRALPWQDLVAPSPTAAVSLGVIAMTTKTKVAALAAVVLAMILVWLAVEPGRAAPLPPRDVAVVDPVVGHGALSAPASEPGPEPAGAREAASPAAPSPTGRLVVQVRHKVEPHAAAGLTVVVGRSGGDFRVGTLRAVTDDEGVARFDAVEPGASVAWVAARTARSATVEIEAGATKECSLELRGGITMKGLVVDAAGVPVGGAWIETIMPSGSGADAEVAAVSAADGTFTVRECVPICLIGARARGFAASQLHFRMGDPGSEADVRIELVAAGGAVEGVVRGPDGKPVAGAVVRVGEGKTDSIMSTKQGAPPLPAQVRSDAEGRFVAIGVPVGTQPIQVRAVGMAPWRGSCEIAASLVAVREVVLTPGAACAGVVRRDDGTPVADARVSVGQRGDFVLFRARTDAEGAFLLRGLPCERVEIAATEEKLGKATTWVQGEPGAVVRCELTLSHGLALRGRVVDEGGAPLARVDVRCETAEAAARWTGWAFTDEQGRFLVAQCPAGRGLKVVVLVRDHLRWQQDAVDPGAGELEVRLQRDRAPRARIVGRLLGTDGRAAVGVEIEAWRSNPQLDASTTVKDPSGAFAIEVGEAAWSVRILADGHPDLRFEPRELKAGEVWDLGTLQLTRGGTLVVHDDAEAKFDYLVFDAKERFVCGLYTPIRPLRSQLIAPGDYVLLARPVGSAAQVLKFTIEADRETKLEVPVVAGTRARVEFVFPAGAEARQVSYEVRRDGALVMLGTATTLSPGAAAGELCLVPGQYELMTRYREPRATLPFSVGAGAAQPIRVVLR